MKKINKLNFFFKYFKVDLWSYFFIKKNFKSRLNQRYFVSIQNNLSSGGSNYFFYKIFKNRKELLKLKYDDAEIFKNKLLKLSNWYAKNSLKKNNRFNNYLNIKNYKLKKEQYKMIKTNAKLEQKKFYKLKLTNINNSLSKSVYGSKFLFNKNIKKFNLYVSAINWILLKKRLGTASYDLFFADFEGYRFKPRSRIRKKSRSKLNWHYWLNTKIISFYLGFEKVKNYKNWKKRLKKKNFFHRYSIKYVIENCLLFFLFNIGFFPSFKHVYSLIKYGGIKINKKVCFYPYKMLKKNYEIEFTTFTLKQKFFNSFLKKTSTYYYPKFFYFCYEIYWPLVIIKKIENFSNIDFYYNFNKFFKIPKLLSWF